MKIVTDIYLLRSHLSNYISRISEVMLLGVKLRNGDYAVRHHKMLDTIRVSLQDDIAVLNNLLKTYDAETENDNIDAEDE